MIQKKRAIVPERDMHNGDYRVSGAAKYLDVSEGTVRNYINNEDLKAKKVAIRGKKQILVITRDELDRFKAKNADA